jgi:hypothetical protein
MGILADLSASGVSGHVCPTGRKASAPEVVLRRSMALVVHKSQPLKISNGIADFILAVIEMA